LESVQKGAEAGSAVEAMRDRDVNKQTKAQRRETFREVVWSTDENRWAKFEKKMKGDEREDRK
jgi:hypothetical protein